MGINKIFILFIFLSILKISRSQNVIELNDKNFEHLTQASTGNTTGSWFIKFYAPWCSHCKALSKTWVQLASELKDKINIAKVDATINSKTRKRFKIEGFPTLLFFKNGKLYEYKNGDRSVEALKHFVLGNYNNFKPLDVPKPLDYVDLIKDFINEMVLNLTKIYKYAFPSLVAISLISFLIGLFFGILLLKCCRKKITAPTKTASHKKAN